MNNIKSQGDDASQRDAEDDLEYLKSLTLDKLKELANGRLVKITPSSSGSYEEWLLPNDQDHIILWSPSVQTNTRFIVIGMYETATKTAESVISNIKSITFHEGLEIRPVLKIED